MNPKYYILYFGYGAVSGLCSGLRSNSVFLHVPAQDATTA